MDQVGFAQMAAAVFVGNIMTLSVFYSLRSFWNIKDGEKLTWTQAAGFLLPLVLVIGAVSSVLP